MQVQLVDEALFDCLADDVATTHDHVVAIGRRGAGLVDCGRQAVHTGKSQTQLPLQPDFVGRRVGDDEERRGPGRLRAVRHVCGPNAGRVDDVGSRRPITTAPVASVARWRIAVSTRSWSMTQAWSSSTSPTPRRESVRGGAA